MPKPLLATLPIKMSSGIPAALHDDLRYLIAMAAEITKCPLAELEIHVKASKNVIRCCGVAYYTYSGKPFAQTTSPVKTEPHVRYLITLRTAHSFWTRYAGGATHVMHYARYKTAPYTVLRTWEEEFFYICAHEMHHIKQYERARANGWVSTKRLQGISEIECELAAVEATQVYRLLTRLTDVPASTNVGKAASR